MVQTASDEHSTPAAQERHTVEVPNLDEWRELEERMTNFDHSISDDAAQVLIGQEAWFRYPGWNFNGRVWHADGQFHCEPWTYHVPQAVISADSLQDLMTNVCAEYGYD